LQVALRVIRRERHRLRHVFLAALVEPVPRQRRALLLFLRRHHEVALTNELLPRDVLRQIRALELPFDPAELADAFGEVGREPEPLADLLKDPEVRLRFAERLDALVLENDDAMVQLLLAVIRVAAES